MPDLPGLLFFAMGVTVAAFIGWSSSLNRLGVARTVVWMNAVPVVGLLVSMSLAIGPRLLSFVDWSWY